MAGSGLALYKRMRDAETKIIRYYRLNRSSLDCLRYMARKGNGRGLAAGYIKKVEKLATAVFLVGRGYLEGPVRLGSGEFFLFTAKGNEVIESINEAFGVKNFPGICLEVADSQVVMSADSGNSADLGGLSSETDQVEGSGIDLPDVPDPEW